MTQPTTNRRITGPLKTWYDLHEALDHEATGIAADASDLTLDRLDALATRFWAFDDELKHHSEVEDGIMFPAIVAAGGTIDTPLFEEHRDAHLAVYAFGTALLHAKATRTNEAIAALGPLATKFRDSFKAHLEHEESTALGQVDDLFSSDEQAGLFRTIIGSLPPDPQLQPWVAAALTPEHLEARLRNIASSMSGPALAGLMTQIRDGVDPETWAEVEARTPGLAELAEPPTTSA